MPITAGIILCEKRREVQEMETKLPGSPSTPSNRAFFFFFPGVPKPSGAIRFQTRCSGASTLSACLSLELSLACFCAPGKHCQDRHRLTSAGHPEGPVPAPCLFDILGLCLSTGFGNRVCHQAHLDKLPELTQNSPPHGSPLQIQCGFYSPTFLPPGCL